MIKSDFNSDELKQLLTEFVEAHGKAKAIAGKIEREILIGNNNQLQHDTLVQFSKWCNTGYSYIGGQKIAEKISMLLFGKIIPRMD